MPITSEQFKAALNEKFQQATRSGLNHVTLKSGTIHRELGYYPGKNHSMPSCCTVMKKAMRHGDVIIHQPPKGNGASVEIKYCLPR